MTKAEQQWKAKLADMACLPEQKTCKRGLHQYTGRTCPECRKVIHGEWKKNNPDVVRKNRNDWAARNKEKVSETNRRQREKNPELRLAKKAQYRETNKEQIAAAGAKYRAENMEAIRLLKANRRAKKRTAGGSLSNGLVGRLMALQRGRCACCGVRLGSEYHIDHIIPIALGGRNSDENMQLLKPRCNLQKKALHPVDFMQKRGFLL